MNQPPAPRPLSGAAITVIRPLKERIEERRRNDQRGQETLDRLRRLCPATLPVNADTPPLSTPPP